MGNCITKRSSPDRFSGHLDRKKLGLAERNFASALKLVYNQESKVHETAVRGS